MNNNLLLRLPIEVIDHVFTGDVSSQVREKSLIAWLGVRYYIFVNEKGDLLTKELRNLLGTEWRIYIRSAAEMDIDPFLDFKRWGYVECESASILKKLSQYKKFKG